MSNQQFSIARDLRETGRVHVPWRVEEFGELVLQTSSLMPRDQPYRLSVELARGQISKVRNQAGEWDLVGLKTAPAIDERLQQANRDFVHAIRTQDDDEAERLAQRALRSALWAGETLTEDYCRHILATRRKRGTLTTQVGFLFDDRLFALEDATPIKKLFNHATIPVDWPRLEPELGNRNWGPLTRRIQWCLDHGFACTVGPIVELRPDGLPAWLLEMADADLIDTLIMDLLESCVSTLQDRISSWETIARPNSANLFGMNEDQMLWLTARMIERVCDLQPQARTIVTIDQPWGDYLDRARRAYSPFAFVDQLSRSDNPLHAVNLEIAMSYGADGSFCRSLLDFSQLLDHYRQVGLPLHLRFYFPSEDVASRPDQASAGGNGYLNCCDRGIWHAPPSPDVQADWLEGHFTVAFAKPDVEVVSWGRLHDYDPQVWPRAGLVDEHGEPKKAFRRLSAVTKACFR